MKKNKLFTLILFCTILLIFSVAFASPMVPEWQSTSISVSYTAEDGNQVPLIAVPTENNNTHAFWVQMEAGISFQNLKLEISNPTHPEYRFNPPTGSVLNNIIDANGSFDGSSTIISVTDDKSNVLDTLYLYISVLPLPTPLETPTTVNANILVKYVDDTGSEIATENINLSTIGYNPILANNALVPQGFELQGEATQSVEVYQDGTASSNTITFTYKKLAPEAVSANVYVEYLDQNNNNIASENISINQIGQNQVFANTSIIPEQYELDDEQVKYVELYQDGSLSQNSLSFKCKSKAAQEVSANLNIQYVDENGNVLVTDTQTINQVGSNTITANYSLLPDSYEISGSIEQTVELYADGNLSAQTITFNITKPEQKPVSITIKYINSVTGAEIANSTTQDLTNIGENIVNSQYPEIQSYKLVGQAQQKVYLYEDGYIDPSEVYFSYEPINTEPVVETLAPAENTETSATNTETPVDTTAPENTENNVDRYAISKNVNLRKSMSKTSGIIVRIPTDKYMLVESINTAEDGTQWAKVEYDGKKGYVSTEFITVLSPEENAAYIASGEKSANPEGLTLAPGEERYSILQYDSNLRAEMNQTSDLLDVVLSEKYVWIRSLAYDANGVQWAKVVYNDKTGYIQAENLKLLTAEESNSYNLSQPTTVPPAEAMETTPPVSINASVRVQYIDSNNSILYQYDESFNTAGSHNIDVKSVNEIVGYELQGNISQTITVDNNGNVEPKLITFQFKKMDITASIVIHYTDEAGNPIAQDTSQKFNAAGNYNVVPSPGHVDSKYTLIEPSSYEVSLSENGDLIPLDITFKYKKAEIKGNVIIEYKDTEGNKLAENTSQELTKLGANSISPNAAISAEYSLNSEATVNVNLNEDGTVTPNTASFIYKKIEKTVTANIVIHYIDQNGNKIVGDTTKAISVVGDNVIFPEAVIPSEYKLTGNVSEKVNLSKDGVATPNQVNFIYSKEAVNTPATIKDYVVLRYVDTDFKKLADDSVQEVTQIGENKIVPQLSLNGYTLQTPSISVNLGTNGIATPKELVFIYKANAPQNIKAKITINYLDQNFNSISPSTQQELSLIGENTVFAKPASIPANYVLMGESTQTVTMNANGVITPPLVNFIYKNTKDDFEHYRGYALTNKQVALRNKADASDSSIIEMLNRDTLVYIAGQGKVNGILYHSVSTLAGKGGFMQDSDITKISPQEAQKYIDIYNNANKPPVSTPTAPPQTGYAVTLGNVPLRSAASEYSSMKYLPSGVTLFVSGVEYRENNAWYISQYNGQWGYIRYDQLRMLNSVETQQYLNSLGTKPQTPAPITPAPYNVNNQSSYGYITKDKVNFRSGASLNSTKIGTLNEFAFALILDTVDQAGTTWYKINYNGKEGYVSGNFFKVMSIKEMQSFLNSKNYTKGINNNTTGTSSKLPETNAGIAAPGRVSSLEDYNANRWQNPNLLKVSYEPFSPYMTPAPTTATGEEPSPTPTMIPLGTMVPTEYSQDGLEADSVNDEGQVTKTTQSSSPAIFVTLLLLVLAGGTAAYFIVMKNKRKQLLAATRARQQQAQRQQQVNPNAPIATPKDPYANPTAYGRQPTVQGANRPMPNNAPPQRANVPPMQNPNQFAQRQPVNDDVFKRPEYQGFKPQAPTETQYFKAPRQSDPHNNASHNFENPVDKGTQKFSTQGQNQANNIPKQESSQEEKMPRRRRS